MRGLAEFIMRSPKHAAGVAVVACVVPYAYWLSAAAVALVVLRRGWQAGSKVLAWGLIPAIGLMLYQHDSSALTTLLGTGVLALILRASVSWSVTLLSSIAVGLGTMLLLLVFQADALALLAEHLHKMLTQAGIFKQLNEQAGVAVTQQFEALLLQVVVGAAAWWQQLLSLVALVLARWWQSVLYVPEGFHKEFYQLRLSPKIAISILLLVTVGLNVNVGFASVLLIAVTPLFFTGLAMFHSIIATQSNSTLGLVVFYLIQVIFAQLMFPLTVLVALLDSFVDFRGRMNKPVS